MGIAFCLFGFFLFNLYGYILNFYSLYFHMRAVGQVVFFFLVWAQRPPQRRKCARYAGLMCRLGVMVSVGIIGLWVQACGINTSLN